MHPIPAQSLTTDILIKSSSADAPRQITVIIIINNINTNAVIIIIILTTLTPTHHIKKLLSVSVFLKNRWIFKIGMQLILAKQAIKKHECTNLVRCIQPILCTSLFFRSIWSETIPINFHIFDQYSGLISAPITLKQIWQRPSAALYADPVFLKCQIHLTLQ